MPEKRNRKFRGIESRAIPRHSRQGGRDNPAPDANCRFRRRCLGISEKYETTTRAVLPPVQEENRGFRRAESRAIPRPSRQGGRDDSAPGANCRFRRRCMGYPKKHDATVCAVFRRFRKKSRGFAWLNRGQCRVVRVRKDGMIPRRMRIAVFAGVAYSTSGNRRTAACGFPFVEALPRSRRPAHFARGKRVRSSGAPARPKKRARASRSPSRPRRMIHYISLARRSISAQHSSTVCAPSSIWTTCSLMLLPILPTMGVFCSSAV